MAVKLWDLRHARRCIKTLVGHHGWVKNVECTQDGLLVSSDFNDTIRVWNLQSPCESDDGIQRTSLGEIIIPTLCRIALSANDATLALSTNVARDSPVGNIMLIHDLDLHHLAVSLLVNIMRTVMGGVLYWFSNC